MLFGTPSSFLIPCLPVNLPSREVGQICLYDSGFLSSFPSAFFVSCVSRYGCFSRAVPSSRRTDPVSVRLRPSPQSILPSRWLCLTAAGLRRLPSGCARNPLFLSFFLATVSCSSMEGVSLLTGVYSGFIFCMASDVTNLSLDYSAHSAQHNR